MPDIFSQDEIDALLTATGSDDGGGGGGDFGSLGGSPEMKAAANKPIITYDFKHPQRVSKDQQRTLENLHSNLSRLMASSFSTIQH